MQHASARLFLMFRISPPPRQCRTGNNSNQTMEPPHVLATVHPINRPLWLVPSLLVWSQQAEPKHCCSADYGVGTPDYYVLCSGSRYGRQLAGIAGGATCGLLIVCHVSSFVLFACLLHFSAQEKKRPEDMGEHVIRSLKRAKAWETLGFSYL